MSLLDEVLNPLNIPEKCKVDKTVFVDVGDDESEFVHVAGKHQHRIALGIQGGDAVTQRVVCIRVGGWFYVAVKDRLCLSLITGG